MSNIECLTFKQLTGLDDSMLMPLPSSFYSLCLGAQNKTHLGHPEAIKALLELQALAERDNQPFQVISSYRSYEQQQSIWNRKYQGKLTVLDANETAVEIESLNSLEKIHAIMLYSALPGASRHHWGTDFDIFPSIAIENGHPVQLVASEFNAQGVAADFEQWLKNILPSTEFFRPYDKFQNGIASEPWHISYYPLAKNALKQLTQEQLLAMLLDDLAGKETICANIDSLYKKYIANICMP
jgi:LAS superfamily LD-carboxypeptidase LdcB